MSIRQIIKRVLREETVLPPSVRRRMGISLDDDTLNELKKASLRMLSREIFDINDIVNDSVKWVAEEMVPYDEDYEDEYDNYVDVLIPVLKEKFEKDIIEYITEFMGTLNGPDTHMYVFKKHSERYGGNGFSTTFDTWDSLLKKYGYWMPLEWDEVKRKLDSKDELDLLISSPGEPTNTMGYYFSIKKISK